MWSTWPFTYAVLYNTKYGNRSYLINLKFIFVEPIGGGAKIFRFFQKSLDFVPKVFGLGQKSLDSWPKVFGFKAKSLWIRGQKSLDAQKPQNLHEKHFFRKLRSFWASRDFWPQSRDFWPRIQRLLAMNPKTFGHESKDFWPNPETFGHKSKDFWPRSKDFWHKIQRFLDKI